MGNLISEPMNSFLKQALLLTPASLTVCPISTKSKIDFLIFSSSFLLTQQYENKDDYQL